MAALIGVLTLFWLWDPHLPMSFLGKTFRSAAFRLVGAGFIQEESNQRNGSSVSSPRLGYAGLPMTLIALSVEKLDQGTQLNRLNVGGSQLGRCR